MKRVVVVGSAIVDVTTRSRAFRVVKSHQVENGIALCEVYGGKMELDDVELGVGGAGTNVAVGLARLGCLVTSIVKVGVDMFGEKVKEELVAEGVDVSMVQTDSEKRTGISVILVAGDGGRSIMTYRGASSLIEGNKIDFPKVASADWIQISSLGGRMDLAEDLIAFAKQKKIGVGFNPGKREMNNLERLKEVVEKVDLLVVNRMEAAMMVRHNYDDEEGMMRKMGVLGPRFVVVTDGRRGASSVSEGVWIKMKAFKVRSVDDTGAGDAFVSGFVTGLLGEKELEVCLKMGLANGASEVMNVGVKTGLLHKKEMGKWMRRRLKSVEGEI